MKAALEIQLEDQKKARNEESARWKLEVEALKAKVESLEEEADARMSEIEIYKMNRSEDLREQESVKVCSIRNIPNILVFLSSQKSSC